MLIVTLFSNCWSHMDVALMCSNAKRECLRISKIYDAIYRACTQSSNAMQLIKYAENGHWCLLWSETNIPEFSYKRYATDGGLQMAIKHFVLSHTKTNYTMTWDVNSHSIHRFAKWKQCRWITNALIGLATNSIETIDWDWLAISSPMENVLVRKIRSPKTGKY